MTRGESQEPGRMGMREHLIRLEVNYLVGVRLYCARLRAGIERNYVAQKTGVEESRLRTIERGSCGVPAAELVKLIELYGIRMEDVMYFTTEVARAARQPWRISYLGAIAIHRFCIDHDFPNPFCSRVKKNYGDRVGL